MERIQESYRQASPTEYRRRRKNLKGAQDNIENIDSTDKENAKCKKPVTQNIQKIQDTMRRPNIRLIRINEREDLQLKGPANLQQNYRRKVP